MVLVIVLIAVLIVAAVVVASGAMDRPRRARRVVETRTRLVHEVIEEPVLEQPVIEQPVVERRVIEDDGVL